MSNIAPAVLRYPNNDPENGPAYYQRFDGVEWSCAGHSYTEYTCHDPETGYEYNVTACCYCGEYKSTDERTQHD